MIAEPASSADVDLNEQPRETIAARLRHEADRLTELAADLEETRRRLAELQATSGLKLSVPLVPLVLTYEVELTPELNRVIERVATATGTTKSEVVSKAIVLMDVAVDAKAKGERLFVGKEPPPGPAREIIGL